MSISVVRWPVLVWIVVLCSTSGLSMQPSASAVEAYKRAVAAVEQRRPLFCSAGGNRPDQILINRLSTQDSDGNPISADGALIHHWSGAMLIPNVRAQDVVTLLQDYDHHAEIYGPEVRSSKLLDKQGARYHVLHESLSRNLITVGLKIESVIEWSGDEQAGFSSHSHTVRVTEFEHAGTPRARERTPNQAKGWMWSEDSWWHVISEADGACVTYETIALTRDIPWGWGWLVRSTIERFPAKTLSDMLDRTRYAVLSRFCRQDHDAFPTTNNSLEGHLRSHN